MKRSVFTLAAAAAAGLLLLWAGGAAAQEVPSVSFNMAESAGPQQVSTVLQIMMLLTVLSMAPAILLMTTSFIRIVVVLSFLRQAMGTQQMPPNQIIIGLAMFLTFFIMAPVFSQINQTALQPYLNEKIGGKQALTKAASPMREFMFGQVREADLQLMTVFRRRRLPRTARRSPP